MAESKKTELEVHRELMTLLSHLTENKARARKKSPMPATSKQEIKADVRKILEQFLKKQLVNNNEEESAIPTGFQRVAVENVIETYGSGSENTSREEYRYPPPCYAGCPSEDSQSSWTGSNRSPTDDTTNFTFIDEDEHDVEVSDKDHSERSNSPPSSDLSIFEIGRPLNKLSEKGDFEFHPYSTEYYMQGAGNTDIKEIPVGRVRGRQRRLKSGTESETDDTDYEKEVISSNEDVEKRAVGTRPAMGRKRLKSGTESETDDIDYEEEFISRMRDIERRAVSAARPAMGRQSLTSGTESETNDTDYGKEFISLKDDIERILVGTARGRQRLMSETESEKDDTDYEEEFISRKKDKKRIPLGTAMPAMGLKSGTESEKKKDIDSSVDKRRDDVQNVHTHKYGHVEQHHYTNGNKSGMLMESEVWESTDVTEESEHKHEERHSNIRESKEQPSDDDNGFMRRLKKMTSFNKSKKDKSAFPSKASKSDEVDFDHKRPKSPKTDYNRSVSSGQGYQERVHMNGDHYRQTTTTTVITGDEIQGCTDENLPEGPIKGEVMDLARKNKSFELDFETCERQQRRLLPDGSFDTTVQQHVKVKHFEEGHDIEVDVTEDQAMRPRHAASGQHNHEKDRLYTAVAEKLAHIGDKYTATIPLSDSTSSSVDLTATKRGSARTPNLPGVDKRGSDGLTALERQLRDTFREVGDKFSLELSPDAVKDAAMDIAKQAMYQKFQEVVDNKIGPGNSWDQIAAVFYLTKKTVTLAGVGGAVALQVKDLAAEYVADKFATWIVDQGGWDTFLDSDSDLDIE